jgi:CheY-like chemotaxis protein
MKKINCIMLIDDNPDDNFYHERVIRKNSIAETVIAKQTATEALEYLQLTEIESQAYPDLIFLDINMPGMNGWEFFQEYNNQRKHKGTKPIFVILTTSDNPDDERKAAELSGISEFRTKPLTKEMLEDIVTRYF